jgi:ribonuclease-3
MAADLDSLMEMLGHRFANPEILIRALTHRSHAYEASSNVPDTLSHNEQYEFLGDAILGFLVSEVLVERYPLLEEGSLSQLKARLVSSAHLFEVALDIGLGRHLLLGRGEDLGGGREKRTLLANALEALIAAIYFDAGLDAVRPFVRRAIVGDFDKSSTSAVLDYKTTLQERLRRMNLPPPKYVTLRESGPEHAKTFTVEVQSGRNLAATGEGGTKKVAGQRAAAVLLGMLDGSSSEQPAG